MSDNVRGLSLGSSSMRADMEDEDLPTNLKLVLSSPSDALERVESGLCPMTPNGLQKSSHSAMRWSSVSDVEESRKELSVPEGCSTYWDVRYLAGPYRLLESSGVPGATKERVEVRLQKAPIFHVELQVQLGRRLERVLELLYEAVTGRSSNDLARSCGRGTSGGSPGDGGAERLFTDQVSS